MHIKGLIIGAVLLAAPLAPAAGAQNQADNNYVSRQEYNALKNELASTKSEVEQLKQQAVVPASNPKNSGTLDRALDTAKLATTEPGQTDIKMLIAGDGAAEYLDAEGSPSTFTAEFNPMLLWQLSDRLFFEGGLEVAIEGPNEAGEDSQTDLELDSAYLTYLVNDWLSVGAGKFTTPFTVYHRHFDPSWINKLPFDPLVYADGGIAPDSAVGVFAIGAMPVDHAMVNYAFYLTNGPALITDSASSAGSLNFDNYTDKNNNKAFGFRVGYVPMRALEIGYSFQFSKPSPGNFETVRSYLHGVDLNFVKDIDKLKGRVTARGAWLWSRLDSATYDPTGALGFGPLRFNNNRSGGYAELAYRPTKAPDEWINNFELVARYDRLTVAPSAPGGGDENRWTPGISYWVTPYTVVKAAYAIDDKQHGEDNNIFALQFATGF